MKESFEIEKLTDHLFRRESGKMVSILTKIFGPENLETAEDVVQQTFLEALNIWKLKGIPDNPSGWLFRVAKNKAIDQIRRNKHSVQFDFSDNEKLLLTSEYTLIPVMDKMWNEELVKDDMLRMMFACCHPGISKENQITLILKTLCGFSTAEIAKTFITTEDTISKRLYRTKIFFRENKIQFIIPSRQEIKERVNTVLQSIYLLFNEGYNSTHTSQLIRKDLIEEAMMLCRLLEENENTRLPEVYALMALMCFHWARNDSRISLEGDIILLADQDRSKWKTDWIDLGNDLMNKAAFGNEISAYHLEAAIAYEHVSAHNFETTNWVRILQLYELLYQINNSPVTALNKAIAVLHVHGPQAALFAIEHVEGKDLLQTFYLLHAFYGEIYSQLNQIPEANAAFETAISLTQSEPEKKMLREKLNAINQ